MLSEIVYEFHLQFLRFTILSVVLLSVGKIMSKVALYCLCLRGESDNVFCNMFLYCVHAFHCGISRSES